LAMSARYYQEAADAGIVSAQANLGVYYSTGTGVEKNEAKAIHYLQLAAEQGDELSQMNLGASLLRLPHRNDEGLKWLNMAAQKGVAAAKLHLGIHYFKEGVQQNHSTAVAYWHEAAEGGEVEAWHNLGIAYQKGLGSRQDNETAIACFEKAAKGGQRDAMLALAVHLDAMKRYSTAREWFQTAAQHGIVVAQTNLGIYYKQGYGGAKDVQMAAHWFHKAAEQGHAGGQHQLAVCYENGLGVPQNSEKATYWAGRAAQQNVGVKTASRPAHNEALRHAEVHLLRQCAQLRSKPPHLNMAGATRAAVLIEPRKFHLLEAVVRNTMHFLGAGWNLHIVVGSLNAHYVTEVLPGWHFGLHQLNITGFNASSHNSYVRSIQFWEAFPEEHVFIFQTDSFLLRSGMEDYVRAGWDMIGAPTVNTDGHTPYGRGYNGGLALRKRSSMLRCLRTISLEDTYEYRQRYGSSPGSQRSFGGVEDLYFSHALEMLLQRGEEIHLPDKAIASNFSVEALYIPRPLGIHGFDKDFLTEHQMKLLLANSAGIT